MMYLPLPRALCCLAVIGMLQQNAQSQTCPGGSPLLLQTYNTTRVGNANNSYALSQFDPTIGTLYSAELRAVVYFQYSYTLENVGTGPENYTVNIFRDDSMYAYSPSNPTPLAVFGETFFRQYKYVASSGTGVPVGTNNYTNNVTYPRTYTQVFDQSVVPFLGSDSLYINYKTANEALTTVSNPNINISNTAAYDSILFQIRYRYCPAATLPSSLLSISSRLQSADVVLSWASENRYAEGWFELLKSTDGKTYSSIHREPVDKTQADGYNFLYKPLATDGSKGFFRIKQTDKNGNVTYSRVLTVLLPQSNNNTLTPVASSDMLKVFPTVTDNAVNLSLPKANASDEWVISVVALSGQVLQQSQIKGSGQVKLAFTRNLPEGIHIISALNKRTNLSYKGKVIVQH